MTVADTCITPVGEPSILVVEDSDLVREAIVSMLTEAGYRVRSADCVRDALRALDSTPMLVVTDWELPQASGLELCRLIRSMRDGDALLVFTSHDSAADRRAAIASGADELVSKSAPIAALRAAVDAAIARLRLRKTP